MKKRLLALASLLAITAGAYAQSAIEQLLGPRFYVNSPAGITGIKGCSVSNKGLAATDTTTNWGRAVWDTGWFNIPVGKASDTLACGSTLQTLNGKFALIYRGNCTFTAKALEALAANAWGVIIVNNVAGADATNFTMSPTGDVSTLKHIPIILISKEDGDAIAAQLNAGTSVKISLSGWGFNKTNDLALIGKNALPPYSAIPAPQLANSGGAPQYKIYTSGYFANTGTADAANPTFSSSIDFTPAGGSSTNLYSDSVSVATFAVADSIIGLVSPNSYDPVAATTGRYDIHFNVHADATDDIQTDNNQTGVMYVTPGTFCNARYDSVNDQPISNIAYRLGAAINASYYISGPLFYNAKGGYQALYSKLFMDDQDTTDHSLDISIGNSVFVMLYKWVDNNGNAIMETEELTYKGMANVDYTTADSNGHIKQSEPFQYVPIDGSATTNVVLEDNSYYWVAAVSNNDYYLGMDTKVNYFSRALAAARATPSVVEFYSPQYWGPTDPNTHLPQDATDTLVLYPFISKEASSLPIDSLGINTFRDGVASISFHVSPTPTAIHEVAGNKIDVSLYPNPVIDAVHVKFNLAQPATTTYINIMTANGQVAYGETRKNVQYDDVSISTSKFAAGNYLMVIRSGKDVAVRKFTVAGK